MVKLMVGRELSEFYDREVHQPGSNVLKVDQVCTPAFPLSPSPWK